MGEVGEQGSSPNIGYPTGVQPKFPEWHGHTAILVVPGLYIFQWRCLQKKDYCVKIQCGVGQGSLFGPVPFSTNTVLYLAVPQGGLGITSTALLMTRSCIWFHICCSHKVTWCLFRNHVLYCRKSLTAQTGKNWGFNYQYISPETERNLAKLELLSSNSPDPVKNPSKMSCSERNFIIHVKYITKKDLVTWSTLRQTGHFSCKQQQRCMSICTW